MILFVWGDKYQSKHHQKKLAFEKALKYVKKHHTNQATFIDMQNREDKGETLNREFKEYLRECQRSLGV